MTECLDCDSIRERICVLLDAISTLEACQGVKYEESGIKIDYGGQLTSKYRALEVLERLEARHCPKGAGDLYELIHVPCVRPATCAGSTCSTASTLTRNRRRYRR